MTWKMWDGADLLMAIRDTGVLFEIQGWPGRWAGADLLMAIGDIGVLFEIQGWPGRWAGADLLMMAICRRNWLAGEGSGMRDVRRSVRNRKICGSTRQKLWSESL